MELRKWQWLREKLRRKCPTCRYRLTNSSYDPPRYRCMVRASPASVGKGYIFCDSYEEEVRS